MYYQVQTWLLSYITAVKIQPFAISVDEFITPQCCEMCLKAVLELLLAISSVQTRDESHSASGADAMELVLSPSV